MRITEPSTLLTDYALGVVSLIWGINLYKEFLSNRQKAVLFWSLAFLSTGAAALTGGTYHGFTPYLGAGGEKLFWKATVFLIGAMSFTMLSGSVFARTPKPVRRVALPLIVLKFLFYAAWMTAHNDFKYVIYDYAPAMLAVLGLHLWKRRNGEESDGDAWIVAGVALSLAGALLQQSGLSLHHHFNHNDLYHIIQMAAMGLFYKGARSLIDWR